MEALVLLFRNMSIGVLVPILCLLASCKMEDPLEPLDLKETIVISLLDPSNATLIADSSSKILLKAELKEKVQSGQSIVFSTTNGVLTLPGVSPNSSSSGSLTIKPDFREAIVQLNVGTQIDTNVIVSASVGSFNSTINLKFVPSYPDELNIAPRNAQIKPDSSLSVEVRSFKMNGAISKTIDCNLSYKTDSAIVLDIPKLLRLNQGRTNFVIKNVNHKTGKTSVIVSIKGTNIVLSDTLHIVYK
jgi:hypothetical protein